MNGGLSIHCIDICRGLPAAGMQVEIASRSGAGGKPTILCGGKIATTGLLDDARLAHINDVGEYFVLFHIAEYYRMHGLEVGYIPYLDVAEFNFQLLSPETHYHFPFKVTPWGYSLFVTRSRVTGG